MGLNKAEITRILTGFSSRKIAVVGDFYLDEYIKCVSKGLSPEAPVPRSVVETVHHAAGCAGNVAMNLCSLGAQVFSFGAIGDDEKGRILQGLLQQKGISINGLIKDNRKTGVFSRIMVAHGKENWHHAIRFDTENNTVVSQETKQRLFQALEQATIQEGIEAIFVADYDEHQNTGIIDSKTLGFITKIAKEKGIKTIGISREKIASFFELDFVICNEKEAQKAGLVQDNKVQRLNQKVIVTRAKDGAKAYSRNEETNHIFNVPSYATKVVDVCGAGDAFSCGYILAVLSQNNQENEETTMRVASLAAAVAVSKEGTAPATTTEILDQIDVVMNAQQEKIIQQEALATKIKELQQQGKKVVFTNGYFDLLNEGKRKFLQKARQLGDVLVVGINSDKSTFENLGPGNPKLTQSERMRALARLDEVSYVTTFEELTPLKIISILQPSILTKGEDYKSKEIIGQDVVKSQGGEVVVIPRS